MHGVLTIALCAFMCEVRDALQSNHRCDARWKLVDDASFFNETLVNAAWNGPFDDAIPRGLFVSPQSRFAFCYIAKNGATSWSQLLHNILEGEVQTPEGGDYEVAARSVAKHGLSGVNEVFSDPGAVRAVFLRDPIARFTSAFLGKCVVNPQQGLCFDPDALKRGPVTMRDAVRWASAVNLSKVRNPHWDLQVDHCGLRHHMSSYTHVGFVDKDTYDGDAACLAQLARVEHFNVRGDVRIFGSHVPLDQKMITSSRVKETMFLKQVFTKEGAQQLYDSTRADYEFFKFPKPEWMKHATGKLYDTALQADSVFLSQ